MAADGYESAPATKLLATHCAACSRPLVDAESVTAGLGPECRRKHGYNVPVPPELRERANHLVHLIALKQEGEDTLIALSELHLLGFVKLALRIAERLGSVTLKAEGPVFVLDAPYSPEATALLRAVPGRRWDDARKVNTFPQSSRGPLWQALQKSYGGKVLITDNGLKPIPRAA